MQANTCVGCHQNLNSDIASAGHPALTFELDGQSEAQPKHWRDEPESGARAWLVGQAVALRETSWRLSLNRGADPQTHAAWQGLVWLLAEVTRVDTTLQPIQRPAVDAIDQPFAKIQQDADALARKASQRDLDRAAANRFFNHLVSLDSEFTGKVAAAPEIVFARAQRLALALERLTAARRTANHETHRSLLHCDRIPRLSRTSIQPRSANISGDSGRRCDLEGQRCMKSRTSAAKLASWEGAGSAPYCSAM